MCIIGGGMAGLSCARRLMEMHMADVTVYEAMDRLGGRVQTMYCEGKQNAYLPPKWRNLFTITLLLYDLIFFVKIC